MLTWSVFVVDAAALTREVPVRFGAYCLVFVVQLNFQVCSSACECLLETAEFSQIIIGCPLNNWVHLNGKLGKMCARKCRNVCKRL